MKNYEKYNEQLKQLHFAEDCSTAYKKIKKSSCLDDGMHCRGCPFRSIETFLKFMDEEYKEPIQLSHDEYVILKNVDNTYKFICRNACSKNLLLAYGKSEEDLRWCFSEFNHLFTFIKGNEIYEIAKLIEDYEKENGNENSEN